MGAGQKGYILNYLSTSKGQSFSFHLLCPVSSWVLLHPSSSRGVMRLASPTCPHTASHLKAVASCDMWSPPRTQCWIPYLLRFLQVVESSSQCETSILRSQSGEKFQAWQLSLVTFHLWFGTNKSHFLVGYQLFMCHDDENINNSRS